VEGNVELAAEPSVALVSGPDGLGTIGPLIADLGRILAPGGAAIFELDPDQAEAVRHRVGLVLPAAAVAILDDLAGLPRFVTVERARS